MKSMAKFKMWLCDWLGYVFVELSLWRVFSRFYALGCWFYRYGEDIHADHADDCQCTDCGGIGYENPPTQISRNASIMLDSMGDDLPILMRQVSQ